MRASLLCVRLLLQFGLTALDVAKRDCNADLVQLIEVRVQTDLILLNWKRVVHE